MENEIEGIDYLVCKICNKRMTRLYGNHLFKKHKISSEEYLTQHPGSKIYLEKDITNVIKNSGNHMKTEKYKKMFSEKIKGENNPNHKSRTTEQERKQRSPFSKEFSEYTSDKERNDFVKRVTENKPKTSINTCIEFYLSRGYSKDDATLLLKERQSTFTLERCILQHGEEKGIEIFNKRQEKWLSSLLKNTKVGYSKTSQELFDILIELYINNSNIYYATHNGEYKLPKTRGGFWLYDFVDLENKKIIEFNGDTYHANPEKYKDNDLPIKSGTRYTQSAQEIWDKDEEKLKIAKKYGFELLIIWSSEYYKDKSDVIKRCIKFLKN